VVGVRSYRPTWFHVPRQHQREIGLIFHEIMNSHVLQTTKTTQECGDLSVQAPAEQRGADQTNGGAAPLTDNLELPVELRGLMLLTALDLDPRPTFIVQLQQTYKGEIGTRDSELVFCNAALNTRPVLSNVIKSQDWKVSTAWQASIHERDHSTGLGLPLFLCDSLWEFYTINDRWRVISTSFPASSEPPTMVSSSGEENLISNQRSLESAAPPKVNPSSAGAESATESPGFLNGLSLAGIASRSKERSTPALSSEFAQLLYRFNWKTTYLGPMHTWPHQLWEMFKLMMTDPRPAMLFWGPHNVMLYNEAVVPLMEDRHPRSIGLTVEEIYKAVWEDLHKPLIAQILETAEAQTHVNTLLCYAKDNDILEEVYADFTSIPVIGTDGRVTGVYQSIVEITEHTLTQRRTNTLSTLATLSTHSRDLHSIWENIISGLKENEKDIPQVLLFSRDAKLGEKDTNFSCQMEGSIRWSPTPGSLFQSFDINDQEHPLSRLFQQAMDIDMPLFLHKSQDCRSGEELASKLSTLLPEFVREFEPGPFGDPCSSIVVFPMRANIVDDPVGFVIWGLNSRQPYNESYQNFVRHIQQALTVLVTSGQRWEENILRSRNAAEKAEMDNASLSDQLVQRIKEARTNELRFTRFVEHGPIGICIYAPDGSMAFANEQWYSMTDFPKDADSTGASWWMPMVFEEDRDYATEMFTKLLVEQTPVHFEIRLVASPKQMSIATIASTWTLVSAYPEVSKESELEAIVACFTDITEQKWAAEMERRRTEDAMEAKRQQEAFVDVTSHEIRNPLSAVLQSAQEISSLCHAQLNKAAGDPPNLSVPIDYLRDTLHAAETIEQCTLHQKRIVDDILTLSKMDAGLLPVIAVSAQPLDVVQRTLEIFVLELSQSATGFKLIIDDSYTELKLDWLEFDTGRLSQMLINLMTNALKFTKQQQDRQIELRVGASSRSTKLDTCEPSQPFFILWY
jgi:signal transduction histidine kinase